MYILYKISIFDLHYTTLQTRLVVGNHLGGDTVTVIVSAITDVWTHCGHEAPSTTWLCFCHHTWVTAPKVVASDWPEVTHLDLNSSLLTPNAAVFLSARSRPGGTHLPFHQTQPCPRERTALTVWFHWVVFLALCVEFNP